MSSTRAGQASSTDLLPVGEARNRLGSHKVRSSRAGACPTKGVDRLRGNGQSGGCSDGPVRLQWPCPNCGETINLTASRLRGHMPAHCRRCAENYCQQGHLRSRHARKNGSCGACLGIQRRRIVEVRRCLECGNDLEISWGTRDRIRRGHARGDFHLKCYFVYMRREGRPASRRPVA